MAFTFHLHFSESQLNYIFDRAYSRKQGHACGITKKGRESPVKGHNCGFLLLIFPNTGHLECYTPSPHPVKRHVFLEFLVKKGISFKKGTVWIVNSGSRKVKSKISFWQKNTQIALLTSNLLHKHSLFRIIRRGGALFLLIFSCIFIFDSACH